MSIKAYQRAATQADSARELEYRAFGQVTAGLVRMKDAPQREPTALAEALEANRKLWNLLSADCSVPENQLPLALRGQIRDDAIQAHGRKHDRKCSEEAGERGHEPFLKH